MDIRTRDEARHHTREMLVDGQVACWLTVIDYQMRIGSARVLMAGIAGVETHREHRMKGYMRILFDDTLRYMTAGGYDVSMLFGIPNFYDKFGYAVCLPASKVTLKTRDAERAGAAARLCTIRPVEPGDLPAILDLYQQANANRTGSLVRVPEYFKGFQKGTWWDQRAEAVALDDAQGQLAGYVAWDKSREAVNVIEVECADASYYPAVLAEVARQAVDKRCGQLTLYLPSDHAFAEFSQRYGCEWSIGHERNAGGMLRIVNQASLFQKLKPVLEGRVAGQPQAMRPAALTVCTDLGTTTLAIDGGGGVRLNAGDQTDVTPIRIDLPQHKLMQLIMGTRSARDLLNDPDVRASDNAVTWLDLLFPRSHPYVWLTDEF